jgi:hypothetical protein
MPDYPGLDYYKYMGESRDELREVGAVRNDSSSPWRKRGQGYALGTLSDWHSEVLCCAVLCASLSLHQLACATQPRQPVHLQPWGPDGSCLSCIQPKYTPIMHNQTAASWVEQMACVCTNTGRCVYAVRPPRRCARTMSGHV